MFNTLFSISENVMIKNLIRKLLGNKKLETFAKKISVWRLKRYGYECLRNFDELLSHRGIHYWLMYGTLLGAVREHGFIPHDDDIDVGMFCKDINSDLVYLLSKRGFVFKRVEITSDNKYRMMTFSYHGISFDIYGYNFDENTDNMIIGFQVYPLEGGDWMSSRKENLYRVCLTHQKYDGIERCSFGKNSLAIPKNAHVLLCKLYGEDYMTPLKGKKAFKSSIIEILPIETIHAKIVPLNFLN